MTTETELLPWEPCPHCEATRLCLVRTDMEPGDWSAAVMCVNCGARGGNGDTEADAITAWNLRPLTPSGAGEGEPVAWRWKDIGWNLTDSEGMAARVAGRNFNVQPLYLIRREQFDAIMATALTVSERLSVRFEIDPLKAKQFVSQFLTEVIAE